jgi:hypothetical protein
MSLLEQCPTDITNLLDLFSGHPYVVGSEPRSFFYDKEGLSGNQCAWCETLDYEMELFDSEWPHDAVYYKVMDVDGSSINVQGYELVWNDDDEGTLVPTGPVLQRVVHETIEEDGTCSYWVVLREAVNSGGGGPQFDDQLRFCPMELLVFDNYCSDDRMDQVYFES